MTRRDLMVLPAAAMAASEAMEGAGARLLYRQRQPDNLEADFSALSDRVTPVESFYVRSHFPVPAGRAESWVIQVEGAVERPLELPVSELSGMRQQTVMATLECAGNSRVFLSPAAAGVQWELGAVGNAEWSGVALSEVLNKAGVKAGAVEVLLEGADAGVLRNDPKPEGPVAFGRSLPLKKAMRPEVLLATRMNGSALTPAHGYPVRAVVPGYYGMASIKWVKRIVVLTEPFDGYFQTVDYGYWAKLGGAPVRRPLYDMTVKSAIAKPSVDEVVRSGARYAVQGWAWTGDADVTNVEFSPDGGRSWVPASLEGEAQRFVWRRWTLDWTVPSEAGERILMSRATDSLGRVQGSAHDPAYGSYVIHHTLPIRVQVV